MKTTLGIKLANVFLSSSLLRCHTPKQQTAPTHTRTNVRAHTHTHAHTYARTHADT